MKEIFELNMEALKQENLALAQICKSYYLEHGNELEQILCERTKNDMINFKVNIDGHNFFMHSTYDPIKEAKNWTSRIDMKNFDTIAVLGIGVGYHLEELFYRYTNKNKVIIEPNLGVFVKLMTVRDIRHLITAKNTFFILSDNSEQIAKIFFGLRESGQIGSVCFEELLSYRTAYGSWYTEVQKDFIKYSKLYGIKVNTSVFFSNDWLKNFFMNIPQIAESINLDRYEAKFKGIPAVIISAGPSLNKNMHLLNEIKDKALIISAGSSINILEKKGIIPHIMVGIDGGEGESRIFNNVRSDNIYFAYCSSIHYDGLKNYKGPKLYFKPNVLEYNSWFESEVGMSTKAICSGASVSNLSLSIARLMGCDPIILVGQDLSYANMEVYAEGAVLKEEQDKVLRKNVEDKNKYYIQETDIYGNIVYTVPSMKSIKVYFEDYVKLNQGTVYLNGTEGGLPIDGITNMPLIEIIDEYCREKYNISGILRDVYFDNRNSNMDKVDKIKDFIEKVYIQSEEMGEKAIKRMEAILDILNNIRSASNNLSWDEIDRLTDNIQEYELYEFFIEPICRYLIQTIKNDRERKSEEIVNIDEKRKYLFEGLLMQYTDVKDKILLINQVSKKVLDEINSK
jgi:hypothetical protein